MEKASSFSSQEIKGQTIVTPTKVYFNSFEAEGMKGHGGHPFLIYGFDGSVTKSSNLWSNKDRETEDITHLKVESDFDPADPKWHFICEPELCEILVVPSELKTLKDSGSLNTITEAQQKAEAGGVDGVEGLLCQVVKESLANIKKSHVSFYSINDSVDYQILKYIIEPKQDFDHKHLKSLIYKAPWNYSIYPFNEFLTKLKRACIDNCNNKEAQDKAIAEVGDEFLRGNYKAD